MTHHDQHDEPARGQDLPADDTATPQPGATITISTPFVEQIGEERLTDYVTTLVEASEHVGDQSADEVAANLTMSLQDKGFESTPIVLERIAEQLIAAKGLGIAIVRDDGTVLHGPAVASPALADPGPRGTADPEDPDRPFYS